MIKEDYAPHKKSGFQSERLTADLLTRVKAYFANHGQALFSSLGRLLRSPAHFILTLLVLAVSLSLAGSFYVLVKNFRQMSSSIDASNQISVYLKREVSTVKAESLLNQFKNDTAVGEVRLIKPEQALDEFKTHSGFGDALQALDFNPLPSVLLIQPNPSLKESEDFEMLMKKYQSLPEVDFVQLDMEWVKRLRALVDLADHGVILLSILFGLAVLLTTSNTIRLELENRRDEVIVAKLVGATDAFVRRPFLYTGFWLGFLAGVLAWFIITCGLLVLRAEVERLADLYRSDFSLVFLNIWETLKLLLISSGLSVLGAWGVLVRQLHLLKPE